MGLNIIPANAVDVLSFSAGPCKGHLFITVSLSELYIAWYSHVQECRNETSPKANSKQQDAFIPPRNSKTRQRQHTLLWDSWAQWYIFGHKMLSLRRCSAGSLSQFTVVPLSQWKCTSPFHYFLSLCCLRVFGYCEMILK